MMEAVNKAGNAGMTYPERDSLFFSAARSPCRHPPRIH